MWCVPQDMKSRTAENAQTMLLILVQLNAAARLRRRALQELGFFFDEGFAVGGLVGCDDLFG